MEGESRRTYIVEKLTESVKPVAARALASDLNVSRQIIVGDIALLRARGVDIVATNSGYVINKSEPVKSYTVRVKHKPEDFYDVLCTIVDEGARIYELYIEHDVYGKVAAAVSVNSRADAKNFAERSFESSHAPLYALTGNTYFLNIDAPSDIVLIRVQRALHEKGYITR